MGERRRIYLDHAATTPLREEALRAMLPHLTPGVANPSAVYEEGRAARRLLEDARERLAALLEAEDFDIVFLSGGTEADNAAIAGAVLAARERGLERPRVVTTAVEHPAVLAARSLAEGLGAEWVEVGVDSSGRVAPDALAGQFGEEVALVSVMAANNETGTIQPLEAVGERTRARGILLHSDAAQWLGKAPLSLRSLPVDLVTLSAHKVGGPRGCGALLVRRGVTLEPLLRGGGQEGGLRAGTENVAAALGFVAAVGCAVEEAVTFGERVGVFRDAVRDRLLKALPWACVNTPERGALPHFLNLSFPRVEGASLLKVLDMLGVAASTGSACNVGAGKLSHVLQAMGRSEREVRGSLRLSFSASSLEEDTDEIAARVIEAVARLEALVPSSQPS